MNRTGLLVLIAAAIVIAAGAFWYVSQSVPTETAPPPQVAAETSTTAPPESDQLVPPAPPGEEPVPQAEPMPPSGGSAEPPADANEPFEPDAGTTAPDIGSTDGDRHDAQRRAMREAYDAERKARAARDREEAESAKAQQSQGYAAAPLPAPPPPPPPPTVPESTGSAPPMTAKPGGLTATPAPAPTRSVAEATSAIPEDIPIFPWPVPKASASQEVPRRLVMGNTSKPTFGSVAERIANALDHAGYSERSYYALADGHGIAIATQLEQINDDGSPVVGQARFEEKLAPLSSEQFSLTSYVKALFTARSGHFRIIVFTLSGGVAQSDKAPSEAIAKSWATTGQTHLPQRYALIPFTKQVTCTALIYEFEKKDYNTSAAFIEPGKISAMSHLIKAGIWTLLGK